LFRWSELSLKKQLLIIFLVLQLLTVALLYFYHHRTQESFFLAQIEEELSHNSTIIINSGNLSFATEDIARVQNYLTATGQEIDRRLTLINPEGRVIADSHYQAAEMDSHADRPEIREITAAGEKPGTAIRYSTTLEQDFFYLARPIYQATEDDNTAFSSSENGELLGFLRLACSLESIEVMLAGQRRGYFYFSLLLILINLVIVYFIARGITRPLTSFSSQVKKISRGDFSGTVTRDQQNQELTELKTSFNLMAEELQSRIEDLDREITKREAILSGMQDGIIAFNGEEKIIMLNPAAEKMLNLRQSDQLGRPLTETIRNHQILNLISDRSSKTNSQPDSPADKGFQQTKDDTDDSSPPADSQTTEVEISLNRPQKKTLRCRYTPLTDQRGQLSGGIIALTDVTELRQLEKIRQEFVANVSHELRTPLTTIIGYLETLQAADNLAEEEYRRFLNITKKEADRLYLLIDDLLQLSRIEGRKPDLTPGDLVAVLDNVFQRLQDKAAAKKIKLLPDYPESLPEVLMVEKQIEQAIYNLVDNAIKYTPEGGQVSLKAKIQDKQEPRILVAISDTGIGISPRDQQRVFERFYRVDKARSRSLGGTGIGLSLVKHIIRGHESEINLESQPGSGSTFSFTLQIAREP